MKINSCICKAIVSVVCLFALCQVTTGQQPGSLTQATINYDNLNQQYRGLQQDIEQPRLPVKVTAPANKLHSYDSVQAPDQLVKDGRYQSSVSVGVVTILTIIMSLVTGIGALPFFFVGKLGQGWAGLCNSIAVGVMVAASFDLVHEGQVYGGSMVVVGLCFGALFIRLIHKYIEEYEDVKFQDLSTADAKRIITFAGVMAAHALGEGIGVGVSFCGSKGWAQGLLVTIAIGVHNVPEGLAVATVLVSRGVRPLQALYMCVLTALPQCFLAVPAFLFVDMFKPLLPFALGFAAGCMLWIVVAELVPEAVEDCPSYYVATTSTISAAALEGFRMYMDSIQSADGQLMSPVQADAAYAFPAATNLLATGMPLLLAARGFDWLCRSSLFGQQSTGVAWGVTAGAKVGIAVLGMHWLISLNIISVSVALALFLCGSVVVVGAWKTIINELNLDSAAKTSPVAEPASEGSKHNQKQASQLQEVIFTTGDDSQHGGEQSLPMYTDMQSTALLQQPTPEVLAPGSPQRTLTIDLSNIRKCSEQSDIGGVNQTSMLRLAEHGFTWLGSEASLERQLAVVESLLVVFFYEVVRGWLGAQSALGNPDNVASRVLLPVSLQGIPVGVVTGGLCVIMLAARKHTYHISMTIAIVMASVAPLVASLSYISQPVGRDKSGIQLLQAFNPNAINGKLYAVVCGAMAMSGCWSLLPVSKHYASQKVVAKGMVVGIAGTVCIYMLLSLLCWMTKYCPEKQSSPMLSF